MLHLQHFLVEICDICNIFYIYTNLLLLQKKKILKKFLQTIDETQNMCYNALVR